MVGCCSGASALGDEPLRLVVADSRRRCRILLRHNLAGRIGPTDLEVQPVELAGRDATHRVDVGCVTDAAELRQATATLDRAAA